VCKSLGPCTPRQLLSLLLWLRVGLFVIGWSRLWVQQPGVELKLACSVSLQDAVRCVGRQQRLVLFSCCTSQVAVAAAAQLLVLHNVVALSDAVGLQGSHVQQKRVCEVGTGALRICPLGRVSVCVWGICGGH
jgi:hypothetical protein